MSSVPIQDETDTGPFTHKGCDKVIKEKLTSESEMMPLKCSSRKQKNDAGESSLSSRKSSQGRFKVEKELNSEYDDNLSISDTTKKIRKKAKKKSKKLSRKVK